MKKYQSSTALLGPILLILLGSYFIYRSFSNDSQFALILVGIFITAIGIFNFKIYMSIFKDKDL